VTPATTQDIENFKHLPDEAGVRLPLVCKLMSCSAPTVWRMAAAGTLATVKVSKRVTLFNAGSLRKVLAGGTA
jgi:hypothetical protein